ncbi:primary amine oxidase-like protein [Tanacetum coccineum]
MDANFLPLYAQVVLSTVDAFVEKQVASYTGVNGDEGVVGIGTCVTGNSPMQNTTVTPMCRPSEVTDGTKNVTAGAEDGGEQFSNELFNEFPSSYATKLNYTSSTKANLQKLESNVPNDADYDVWLPLALIHEFSFIEGVDFVIHDGQWMVCGIPISLNKWSPSMRLLKEELSHVPVWVKFHDETYGVRIRRAANARVMIEINACKIFSDNLVMDVLNLERNGYTIETIPTPKRVVNIMDKGNGQTSGADDEGFIEVKKKKTGGNNGGNKNFKPISASKLGYNKESPNNKGNGFFSLSYSFGALNVENLIIEKVETSNKATTSGMQEEGQSSTPLVERINVFEKQILECKLVLVDDDETPLETIVYLGNTGSKDEVEHDDNETTIYLASKPMRVRYGPKSFLGK